MNAGEDPCPRGPCLLPGAGGAPRVWLRRRERQGQGR